MPFSFTLPDQYGYVLLAAAGTMILNTVHGMNTNKWRSKSHVSYPAGYASEEQMKASQDAYIFNCAQRAHANFTENHTSVLASLLIVGLQYPITAAILGATWCVGRYLYMIGYCNPAAGKKGKGRYRGAVHYVGHYGLLLMVMWMGGRMVAESQGVKLL